MLIQVETEQQRLEGREKERWRKLFDEDKYKERKNDFIRIFKM
jgi:hypothetical protein